MSDIRDDLLKTVDRVFDAHCPKQVRESAEAGAWPAALWLALEEVGLVRAALPEKAGGSGIEFEDAMFALRRSAYHGAPVPLAETMLAVLAGHVAAASAAADAAVEASRLAPDEFAVSVAKSRIGEAAGKGAEIAHQVHGAMGYTREHNLHYSTRRLWSWRDEFGNEAYWQTRLGRVVAAQGADALWPTLSRL